MSVLFVDVADFTPYSEKADPEQIREIQNAFFGTVRRIVRQYGGVVEKYIGDAVMALFGAPVTTEADAVRCVRAALELQRVLTRQLLDGGHGLGFRIGIATGEALVDMSAARDGGQGIASGDVVNTASRLQTVAPISGVLVCGTTHAATSDAIRYTEHEPVILRGRSTPTEVWLAVGALRRRTTDLEADRTPMIDRVHELGLLANALDRTVLERMPQLITVLGQPGIGKSRLVRELFRYAVARPDLRLHWRTGHCPPFGENVTYAAFADIVKAQAGILDSDNAQTARDRLDTMLAELVSSGEAARLSHALAPLVGLSGEQLPAEDAESAWRRFVVALAAKQPTVLVVEDVQWADPAMLRFLERLGTGVRDVPLLVLCTARPELLERNPSWRTSLAGTLTASLGPMRDTDVAAMYAALLGQSAFPAQMLDSLVEKAAGNPLYAHEYVRMLIERKVLRRTGRAWSLDAGPDIPVPASVQAVIGSRLDLLSPNDRAVLQAAAVVGVQFWPGAVAAALGLPAEPVVRSLRRLEQRELVHEQPESTMAGQAEYRFRHVLVRDVSYRRLPRTERIVRHQRAADWLDAVGADGRTTDLAEVLANHRYAAHEIARTVGADTSQYAPAARETLHRAARRAYALHALDTAAGHVSRALGLFSDGVIDEAANRQRRQLELLGAELAFLSNGDLFIAGGGRKQLTELAAELLDSGDTASAARAETLLGTAAWSGADRTQALSCLDRALRLYAELPDSEGKATAHAELARLHMLNYELDPAIESAATAVAMAERLGLIEVRVNAMITIGTARYFAGDITGLADLEQALRECRSYQLPSLRRVLQNLVSALQEECETDQANRLMVEGRKLDVGDAHSLATQYSETSFRAYLSGDWPGTLAAAGALRDTPTGEWDLQSRAQSAWLTELCDPTGTPGSGSEAGPDEVADAVAAARRSGFRRLVWSTLAHGALCRALQDRADEADTMLTELDASWREVRSIPSGEWVCAAAHAAALLGPAPSARIEGMLRAAPRQTPWVDAALRTATAGVATGHGDPARAGELHAEAAGIFERIGDASDCALSLAAAARAYANAGDWAQTEAYLTQVRQFATRNRAARLLDGIPGQLPPAAENA